MNIKYVLVAYAGDDGDLPVYSEEFETSSELQENLYLAENAVEAAILTSDERMPF